MMCMGTKALIYSIALSAVMNLAALTSCSDKHESVAEFIDLPSQGWVYGQAMEYQPVGLDSVALRRLLLTVRHSNAYPYRNIWLEVTTDTKGVKTIDTLNLELADVYGRWYGSGFGPSYQYEAAVGGPKTLSDSSRIAVRHIMRIDTLREVEQIGFTINSIKNSAQP